MIQTKLTMVTVLAALALTLQYTGAGAKQLTVGGRTLNLFGYVTQGVSYGLEDQYDTEKGINQLLFNLLVEGDYSLSDNLKLYAAGMLTTDWIYEAKDGDDSWNDKLFDESDDNLQVDDEYWQLLKELHFTWTSPQLSLRVGKQIVSWGEMIGIRLMDQINPLDQRRGMADVEFETTVIPIWLLKTEYFAPATLPFVDDLGIEFVFNPNADFIPNQKLLGNDEGGIWSPNITVPLGPGMPGRVGSGVMNLEEPEEWDPEGFEYGVRLKGVVGDALVTLNYFYGIADDPVTTMAGPPQISMASDGLPLLHSTLEGKYPRFKFSGATVSRDITFLRAPFLGDVAPMLFLEAFYAFDSSFATSLNTIEESDEFRWAVGVDWKIKIPPLNPRTYFNISPQYYHQKIIDYPSGYEFSNLKEDNRMFSLMVNTSYMHNKITPSFFWMHDIDNDADMYKAQISYDHSDAWRFTFGGVFLDGEETGKGFQIFENKDYVYFKISYKWG